MKKDYKLILFDMDGTLLKGRTIVEVAEKLDFGNELKKILDSKIPPYKKTQVIACFLKDVNVQEFLSIFQKIPLADNAEYLLTLLKEKELITSLATDSYQIVAENIKTRLKLDYVFANKLVVENNRFTGEIHLHNKNPVDSTNSCRSFSICKRDVLLHLCETLSIPIENTIAVGDNLVDSYMIEKAGLGIAINAPDEVRRKADICINNLIEIVDFIA